MAEEYPQIMKIFTHHNVRRWYVLTLPASHRGGARGLQQELESRIRNNEPLFEYFAPTYVTGRNVNGRDVEVCRPLLFNYVFVRMSEQEIRQFKRRLPQYNFLPRITVGGESHYPYIQDSAMENFMCVASAYSNNIPAYAPDPQRLVKGDKVRIKGGPFDGVEATIVCSPGAGMREIVVCVDDWLWVPLMHIAPGQYEVISFGRQGKRAYAGLDNERIHSGLHDALCRRRRGADVMRHDRDLAEEAVRNYASLTLDTDVMRVKQQSLLLMAHTILGHTADCLRIIETAKSSLTQIKADQSRALLLVTLYGCTGSPVYRTLAHTIISPWCGEPNPKKSKARLIARLNDYDEVRGGVMVDEM